MAFDLSFRSCKDWSMRELLKWRRELLEFWSKKRKRYSPQKAKYLKLRAMLPPFRNRRSFLNCSVLSQTDIRILLRKSVYNNSGKSRENETNCAIAKMLLITYHLNHSDVITWHWHSLNNPASGVRTGQATVPTTTWRGRMRRWADALMARPYVITWR